MAGETKAVLLKSVSALESLNIIKDAGTFLPDSVHSVCVFSEVLLSLLMVLFLSIFDEDGIIFSAKKFYQNGIEETRDEEPPERLGGFSFYTLLLLRLLLEEEDEELSEELLSSSLLNFSQGTKQS